MPESKFPKKSQPHTHIEPFSMGHIVTHRDKSMHIFDKQGYFSTGEHIMDHLADHLNLHGGKTEEVETVGPRVKAQDTNMPDRYGEGAFSTHGAGERDED